MEQFDLRFSYSGSQAGTDNKSQAQRRGRRHYLLQRAVLKWLMETDPPAGVSLGVSTRILQFRADVAAFWNHKVRNPHQEGPANILKPNRTLIVECYSEREECWPDCAKAEKLVAELADWKNKRSELEEEIRRHEPMLRDDNVLFTEYAEWRYEDSENSDYHRVHRKIVELEKALLKGTRFEKICSSELADQLLLAVPAGMFKPQEMADGWGLLWVHNDLKVEMVRPPDDRECIVENRLHLVQNIASSATNAVLFGAGLQSRRKGGREQMILVQPPRTHRRAKRFRLDD